MLPKEKGDRAVGHAIRHFLSSGYEVLLPIGDKRPYDLVVEQQGRLQKVQVKYGGRYRNHDKCTVALRVMGGNQSYHTAKRYSVGDFDLLFVYTATDKNYLVPWEAVVGKSSIRIECGRYSMYSID